MAIPEVVTVQILCKVEDVSNDQREMGSGNGQGNAHLGKNQGNGNMTRAFLK